jgi:hypothetical protein
VLFIVVQNARDAITVVLTLNINRFGATRIGSVVVSSDRHRRGACCVSRYSDVCFSGLAEHTKTAIAPHWILKTGQN